MNFISYSVLFIAIFVSLSEGYAIQIRKISKQQSRLRREVKTQDFKVDPNFKLPASFDWTQKGWIAPVKAQTNSSTGFHCGSCYANAGIGAIEAQFWIKNKTNVTLSVQKIVDCGPSSGYDYLYGCKGGNVQRLYLWASQNKDSDVLVEQKDYPLTIENKIFGCKKLDKKVKKYSIQGYYEFNGYSELELRQALVKLGPVAAAINANKYYGSFYKKGTIWNGFNDKLNVQCDPDATNHEVLVVGYGTMNGVDYWKIKNSYNTTWGENGYGYLKRLGDKTRGLCGITNELNVPIV